MPLRPRSAPALALLALLACDSPRSAPDPAPAPPPPAPVPERQAHMGELLDRAAGARDALVKGDLTGTGAALAAVAAAPQPPGVDAAAWSRMTTAAAGPADSFAAAGQTLGATLAACGGCHGPQGVVTGLQAPPPPLRGPGVQAHMARHEWAVARMFDAVLSAQQAGWSQAAAALNDHPLGPDELNVPPDAAAAAEELHQLGKELLQQPDADIRAMGFGKIVAACGRCHATTGRGPR